LTNLEEGNLTLLPLSKFEMLEDESRLRIFSRTTADLDNLKERMPGVKKTEIMTAVRGPQRRVTKREKSERRKRDRNMKEKVETPKTWKFSFKNYRVVELRQAAVERGLSDVGIKKDLLERLDADEEVRFSQAMEEYERAVQELEQASS
jgi:hypothetical protein